MPSRTRNPSRNRRTVRVARWSATHPWRAVALWLVFIGACIAIGNLGGLNEQGDLDGTVGQSVVPLIGSTTPASKRGPRRTCSSRPATAIWTSKRHAMPSPRPRAG